MHYLKNAWYMFGWRDELGSSSLLARTLAEQPIVMFRGSDRKVVALRDLCPHRFAPLSRGRVSGGVITCGYHGLGFDQTGRCVVNPHGPVPRVARVEHLAAVEQHGILWVWLGTPESAQPSNIPDLSFLEKGTPLTMRAGYMHTRANYQLCVDNILDLSHADFLHPASLGGGATTRTRCKVAKTEAGLNLSWDMKNEVPLPVIGVEYPGHERLDLWIDVIWTPPGIMYLEAGGGPPGTPRTAAINTFNAHIMMPEGPATTHYFYCNMRNFRIDDADFHEHVSKTLRCAFETEDKPMLEAQQLRIGERDLDQLKPLLLGSDAGPVAARRMLAARIAEELSTQSDL